MIGFWTLAELLTGGGALAAPPCDVDNDGYQRFEPASGCTPTGGSVDCNDTLFGAGVHPNATETALDGIDQNCNGADGIFQRLEFDMSSAGWTTSGSVLWTGGAALVSTGASITQTGTWLMQRGRLHVVVDVDGGAGGCPLKIVNAAPAGPNKTSFGIRVATGGDLDGDGYSDILVRQGIDDEHTAHGDYGTYDDSGLWLLYGGGAQAGEPPDGRFWSANENEERRTTTSASGPTRWATAGRAC